MRKIHTFIASVERTYLRDTVNDLGSRISHPRCLHAWRRHIHFGESRQSAINAVSHLSTLLDEEHMYGAGEED